MTVRYRPNAAVIVTDGRGRVLLCERGDDVPNPLQTVQGGIDPGESPRDAAIREMGEELGLQPDEFCIVDELGTTYTYDFPPAGRSPKFFDRYIGQEQHFFLAEVPPDTTFRLDADEVQEFIRVRWGTPQELAAEIWPPKQPGTVAALKAFGLLPES